MVTTTTDPVADDGATFISVNIRANPAWHRWLKQLARDRRAPISSIIDIALDRYAEVEGIERPPLRTNWR